VIGLDASPQNEPLLKNVFYISYLKEMSLMLTVYILASHQEERYVMEFWKHTASLRRQLMNIAWTNPLYVEDLVETNAIVPAMPESYVVIGCLSNSFVSALLDQPALRELVEGALRQIPFIISPCLWEQAPCPFAGKMPATYTAITSTSQQDRVLVNVVQRVRDVLLPFV
jgi:hypothetical protein